LIIAATFAPNFQEIAVKYKTLKLSRRNFLKHSGATLASISLASSFPTLAKAVTDTRIKVGVLAPSHCALPMVYSDLAGTYREHGLKVDIKYATNMPELAKGLRSGELHFGHLMAPMIWAFHTGAGPFKGMGLPLVSPMWAGTNGGAMVVRKDANINLPTDLKGKTIGVHSNLLFHYLITMELLARYNLTEGKEVTVKIINMKDMIHALQEGEIDAFINPEPLCSAAVAKGIARDFLLTKDLWYRHPCCCLTAKKSLFDSEPGMFKDFVSATMTSSLNLNATADRNEKLKMVWERSPEYQKMPLKVLQSAFTPGRTDFNPFPYQSTVKIIGHLLQQHGLLAENLVLDKTAADIFLSDYARDIMRTIGAKKIPASNERPEQVVGKLINVA